MLYFPKWTPLTLDHLIGWLESKSPTEYFNVANPNICLFGQYYRSLGLGYIVSLEEIEKQLGIPENSGSYVVFSCETFGDALVKFKELKCRIEETSSLAKQS